MQGTARNPLYKQPDMILPAQPSNEPTRPRWLRPVLVGELGTLYGLMDAYGPQARIVDVVRDLQRQRRVLRLNKELAA